MPDCDRILLYSKTRIEIQERQSLLAKLNAESRRLQLSRREALAQADRLKGEHRELQTAAEQVQRQISIDERDYLHMFEEGTVGAEIEAEEDGRKPEAQLLAQIKQRKEFYL